MTEHLLEEVTPRLHQISFNVMGNPVSQNAAWRIITFQRRGQPPHASLKLSDEGTAFKAEIGRLVALVRPKDWDRENEYIVDAVYFFDSRRPDVDGPGKLVLDSLADFDLQLQRKPAPATEFVGLFRNDRQVWQFNQHRELDHKSPRAEITVRLRKPWKPVQRPLL